MLSVSAQCGQVIVCAEAGVTRVTIPSQYQFNIRGASTESPVDFRRSLTIDRKSEIIVDVPDNLPFDTWRSRVYPSSPRLPDVGDGLTKCH
jgi:hypothetical protein